MNRSALGLVCLILCLCTACAAQPPAGGAAISVSDPWVRAAVAGSQATSAAYMVIRNNTGTADRLVAASCQAATSVELHRSEMSGGMMKMAPVDGLAVPARGEIALKPGSYHVMMIGLPNDLQAGEPISLTLRFERTGDLVVNAVVRAQ